MQQPRTLNLDIRLRRGDNPRVIFEHDGPPFKPEHLGAIAWQYTSKVEEEGDEGATGRFGSGFITTFLLSKRVEIGGEVVDGSKILPFSIEIRRDTTEKKEMERFLAEGDDKISRLLEGLKDVPEQETGSLAPTTFTYKLDERGIEVANFGVADLVRCASYLLGFNKRLGSVTLDKGGLEMTVQVVNTGPSVPEFTRVEQLRESGVAQHELFITSTEVGSAEEAMRLTLAVRLEPEAGGVHRVAEIEEDVPKVFRRFPLVGSEVLKLPFVLESTYFEPTEPRTGLELKGDGDTIRRLVAKNKRLLSAVPALYKKTLRTARAQNWNDLWRLLQLPNPDAALWLDNDWYAKHVLEPLRRAATSVPVVRTVKGHSVALAGDESAVIPKPYDNEMLWELLSKTPLASRLPVKDDLDVWRKVQRQLVGFKEVSSLFTMADLVECIAESDTIQQLADGFGIDESEALQWLHDLVKFLDGQDHAERRLLSGVSGRGSKAQIKSPILPNQQGDFKPLRYLSIDAGDIPEPLKDIAHSLGTNVRDELLAKEIDLNTERVVSAKSLAQKIEERVKKLNTPDRSSVVEDAFGQLFAWVLDNKGDAERWFSDGFIGSVYRTLQRDTDHLESFKAKKELDRLKDDVRNAGFSSPKDLIQEVQRLRKAQGTEADDNATGNASDDPFGTVAHEVAAKAVDIWATIRTALESEGGTVELLAKRDLEWWRQNYPGLFKHVTKKSTIEKYLEWLDLLEEAKRAVKAKLDAHPSYDVSEADWRGTKKFPTIIPGAFRVLHTNGSRVSEHLDLVVRPAYGGAVVLYWEEEREWLSRPRTELWVAGGSVKPQVVTLGSLAKSLNITRFPIAQAPAEQKYPAVN